ncbi:MAG TPA: hypothetical protein VGR26_04685 [Acidimicrobiales bacterium]|nr:hypothetical protein [Acidimicrobiales bacterium]
MTKIGGIEMPGDAAGVVALDEVVIHGWELARPTGQDYFVDGKLLEAMMGLMTPMAPPWGS